jgi:protein O-GlcNAc transferase
MHPPISEPQQILARAFAAHQAGDIAQAQFLYKLVLQADKKQFDALHMLGVIEGQRGNYSAGLDWIDKALRIRPKSPDALINRGRMQSELGNNADAVATFKKALVLDPQSVLAHSHLGIVLRRQKHREEALTHCDAALKLAPDYAAAWNNRGNVLFDLDRLDDALVAYGRALALQPNLGDAHLGRGNVLNELKRHDEALAAYDRALAINPALGEAWVGRGNALVELKRYDDGLAAYDQALGLKADIAGAWFGRGNVFIELKRYRDAVASLDSALALNPDLANASLLRLHAKQNMCDWSNFDAEIIGLSSAVSRSKSASTPFAILSMPSSPADQLKAARRYATSLPHFPPLRSDEAYSHDRIRLAYVSSDYREHAVSYLTAGLFEYHDRSRFETTAISLGSERDSAFRRRLQRAFEHFLDCRSQSDKEIAGLIRQLEIDIVVDLNGFTRDSRVGIFAHRPAPIQINYLGYAGTMGAASYDYIVADETVIPREHFDFYSEKAVWLPDCFMVNDATRPIAERTPTRSELQLPEAAFVFCCFNQSYKINRATFDVWMRLLQAVDGSVLWLKKTGEEAVHNLQREAERRGVAPERLVFAPSVALAEDHLARHRRADLFLDTLPYNAHATACDALWAGLPVVTCIGSTFAGRVAASVLSAVGLPELVTASLEDYEALALSLARDPSLLASVKAKLARNRDTYPLFDTAGFTRNIEAAYTRMWQRHRQGEPLAHFAVPRLDHRPMTS